MQKQKFIRRLCIAAGLFLSFCGMYAFTVPELDMFVFAKDYGASASLWSEALRYGNGRLLGNLLGFFFSLHYTWAFLVMACVMTAIVLLLNRVACGGSLKTVFLPALVLAFPSAKMVQDVYGVFAAFTNYAVPVMFFLLNVRLLQILSRRTARFVRIPCLAVLFVSSAAATLFSENTTLVLCAFAILYPVYGFISERRISAHGVVHLLGALLGGACMVLLPKHTHSTSALDGYRGTVFGGGIVSAAKAVFGGVLRTCGIGSTFTFAVFLLSLAFLLRLHSVPPTRALRFVRIVLAAYPFLSLLLRAMEQTVVFSRAVQCFELLPALLYGTALVIAVSRLDKPERTRQILAGILLLSSVVPMLFVSTYGYRTYYITWVLLLLWSLSMLYAQRETLLSLLRSAHFSPKALAAAFACIFAVASGVYAIQSVVNFDVHALRTQQIEQAVRTGQTDVTVPLLPCRYLSGEDQWPYSVPMILPDGSGVQIRLTAEIRAFDDSETYVRFARKQPLYALRFAAQNRRYLDPLVLARTVSGEK